MKSYGVRFYKGRVGADGNAGLVSQILLAQSQAAVDGAPMPQHHDGSCKYEIRDFVSLNGGASFKGVLAVLRDDAPHIRGADGAERSIPLDENEHVIEKNHFLFFRANELLVWQVNGRASHISRFEQYLTMLAAPETVSFDDVINRSSLERLEQGVVKRLKVRLAKPKNAAVIDPENWEHGAFEMLNGVDGTTIQFEISTRRKTRGLAAGVKLAVHRLLDRAETRALNVKLEGDREPIDIFADCVREKIQVQMNGLYPFPESIYTELASAKDRQQVTLDNFFGVGDAVLE